MHTWFEEIQDIFWHEWSLSDKTSFLFFQLRQWFPLFPRASSRGSCLDWLLYSRSYWSRSMFSSNANLFTGIQGEELRRDRRSNSKRATFHSRETSTSHVSYSKCLVCPRYFWFIKAALTQICIWIMGQITACNVKAVAHSDKPEQM